MLPFLVPDVPLLLHYFNLYKCDRKRRHRALCLRRWWFGCLLPTKNTVTQSTPRPAKQTFRSVFGSDFYSIRRYNMARARTRTTNLWWVEKTQGHQKWIRLATTMTMREILRKRHPPALSLFIWFRRNGFVSLQWIGRRTRESNSFSGRSLLSNFPQYFRVSQDKMHLEWWCSSTLERLYEEKGFLGTKITRFDTATPDVSCWQIPSFTMTNGTVPAPSPTQTTLRLCPFPTKARSSSLIDSSGNSSETPTKDADLVKRNSVFVIIWLETKRRTDFSWKGKCPAWYSCV